jgi:hypothetical protein
MDGAGEGGGKSNITNTVKSFISNQDGTPNTWNIILILAGVFLAVSLIGGRK